MQLGISVAGHNMANATTEGYTRQKVVLQAERQGDVTHILGAGADVEQIQRVHDVLLERRIQSFKSDDGLLQAQKDMLEIMESNIGQIIDRQSRSVEGAAATQGVGSPSGIAEFMDQFFTTASALASDPTSSALRHTLANTANTLSQKFNDVSSEITELRSDIADEVDNNVEDINELVASISLLNDEIVTDEKSHRSESNDLRDRRQLQVEKLSELVNLETSEDSDGYLLVSVDGVQLSGKKLPNETLESFTRDDGSIGLRSVDGQEELTVSSGRVAGLLRTRDEVLPALQAEFDELSSALITEVNAVYTDGYDLVGGTGKSFFTGSDASDIAVSSDILEDPALIQGSLDGEKGDNGVFLNIFEISNNQLTSIGNQTLNERYAELVGNMGQSIRSVEEAILDNKSVGEMLQQKRDRVSGVSLDEEMTQLIQFQRAYQASARIINIIDQMIGTAINLGV